jgi:hypothetical protein
MSRISIGTLLAAAALPIWGQDCPRGHWTGAAELPNNQSLAMEVDLDKGSSGWTGSINIPAQNASGIPLEAIAFKGGKCTFRIPGAPGDPTFTGAVSADSKTFSGDFTQGGGSFPFKFTLAGEPKVVTAKPSPPVAKEFLGTWEGTLEGPSTLRLVLKISNDTAGAKAVLISIDQGNAEIPVSAITQKDSKLTLSVNMVGGRYEGEIDKQGAELTGTWTQGAGSLPLKLKKSASSNQK